MRLLIIITLLVSTSPSLALADQQVWPGHFQLAIGGGPTLYFGNETMAIAPGGNVRFEFQGRIARVRPGSLWLGAGFGYVALDRGQLDGGQDPSYLRTDYQPIVFATMSFERRISIPLVPFVRVGVGGDVIHVHLANYDQSAGAIVVRFGGGFDYWFKRRIGVGLQSAWSFGPRISHYQQAAGSYSTLYGSWELGGDARVAF